MCKQLFLLTACVLVLGTVGYAEDIQWIAAGRNNFWSTAANWDLGRAPTLADDVRIDVPAAAAPNGPIIQEGITAQANGIFNEAAGQPTLTMTGGTLEVTEWIWWGDGQDSYAVWTMSGGTVTIANEFELGWGGGAGTLTMTGGTISAGEVVIPTGSGAFGELFLYGGTFNVTLPGGLEVNANGLIDITEGTLVLEGDDTAKVNDLVAAGLIISYAGEGVFEMDYDVTNPGKTTVIALAEPRPEPTGGPKIAWVSYHAADDEPHADAAAVGFTQAPDIGYTDLLKAQGYNVVRVLTSQTPDVEYLNTMDLVIISRTASSGHYSGSGATAWNSITAPMINLNGYTLRNSRLGFTDGADMPDTTGDIRLTVTDPTHPIFAGIALTDGTMDNLYAEGAVPLPTDGVTLSRGISINNNNIDDEGTVLATIAEVSVDTGPVGGMVIAELPAGATMENSSGSPTDVLGGPRLVFLTGSREPDGVTGGQAAALYDLYPDGEQMFLNAVNYMAPVVPTDPGTDGLVASYTFDADANDTSGNGYNGTLLGDAAVQDGVLMLDGDDDAVDVPTIGSNYSQLTYSMKVYPTQDLVPLQFSGGMNTNTWAAGAVHFKMNYGVLNVGISGLDGGDLAGTTIVEPNKWNHIALVVSNTRVALYLNGMLEDSRLLAEPLSGLTLGDATIGAWNNGGTDVQREMAGQMDDVLIYSRGLSVNEISYLAGNRAPYKYDGDALDDTWDHDNGSDAWDGTGPGDPNGAPGGAGALVEDDVTFLRIQDTGDPRDYGFSDPSNRKICISHPIDFGLDGTRLEFRIRVATSAPLDDLNPDGGAGIEPWPESGIGYHIRDDGKGMLSIGEVDMEPISFSLAKAGEIEGLETDALVMNHLVGTEPSDYVDTEDAATATAVNIIPIEDATAWNSFVIDIVAGGAGTHTLTISTNGGPAEVFEVTAGTGGDIDGNYIAMGSSGTGAVTAYDMDYISVSLTPPVVEEPPAPVGHWTFDEGSGTTVADVSGNGNDGTIVGNPTWIDGIEGTALEFHGLGAAGGGGDYINCGSGASLDIAGPISIALWIRPDAEDPEGQGTETAPMAKAMSGVSPWNWQVRYGWGGPTPYMSFTFNTSPRAWASVGQNLTQGEWSHIACSHDGETLKCYLNGVETDSTPMGAIATGEAPVLIGSDGWGCDWIGAIDDVRIYDVGLSGDEILDIAAGM